MATIASGTWDTPQKTRSKYKMYDTKVYELVTVYRQKMNDFVRMGIESNNQILLQWCQTEQGKFLNDRIRDPEVVWSRDHVRMVYDCYIRAYVTKEDLMIYKLTFGADACM